MARKRFVITAEPEPDLIPSRTDAKKERVEYEEGLMELSVTLVDLKEKLLGRLPLPDSALDAIAKARVIKAAAARHRALRVVRSVLREMDTVALRKALDRLHEQR